MREEKRNHQKEIKEGVGRGGGRGEVIAAAEGVKKYNTQKKKMKEGAAEERR
jgi:hypothetical protein